MVVVVVVVTAYKYQTMPSKSATYPYTFSMVLVKEKTNMELAYSESPRKWPLETVVDGSRQKSAHCSDTKYNDIQALNT